MAATKKDFQNSLPASLRSFVPDTKHELHRMVEEGEEENGEVTNGGKGRRNFFHEVHQGFSESPLKKAS